MEGQNIAPDASANLSAEDTAQSSAQADVSDDSQELQQVTRHLGDLRRMETAFQSAYRHVDDMITPHDDPQALSAEDTIIASESLTEALQQTELEPMNVHAPQPIDELQQQTQELQRSVEDLRQMRSQIAAWQENYNALLNRSLEQISRMQSEYESEKNNVVRLREATEAFLALSVQDLQNRADLLKNTLDQQMSAFQAEIRDSAEQKYLKLSTEFAEFQKTFTATDLLTQSSLQQADSSADTNGSSDNFTAIRADMLVLRDQTIRALGAMQQQMFTAVHEQSAAIRAEHANSMIDEHAFVTDIIEERFRIAGQRIADQAAELERLLDRFTKDQHKMTQNLEDQLDHSVTEQRQAILRSESELEISLNQVKDTLQDDTDKLYEEYVIAFRQIQFWQSLTFILTLIALVVGAGAFLFAYFHL